ncbi:MAG TPA: fasciclin domain-containing protein [Streptosporangiaceae bacterium]|nr:fasciclin domain-containing protein [Streptosporangiaceae bacterium]
MRSTVLMVAAAAIGVSVAAAGCGSNGNSASIAEARHRSQAGNGPARTDPASGRPLSTGPASSSPETMASAAAASRESAADATFGPACAKIPATGAGSRSGMAALPVVAAAAHNPLLTDLAHAAAVAGLTSRLNSASAVTVFAPDNSAFRALGKGNYKTLMANRADLAKVLKYHVVTGRVTPAELAKSKSLPTLAGLRVHPVKSKGVYKVNGARVICGNLHTANATIYIVNEVLVPTI